MKIILLQDIKRLGKKFDIKEVKDGYARNFLIPRKMAQIATEQIVRNIEKMKKGIKENQIALLDAKKQAAEQLNNKKFHFHIETGSKGEIYSSVQKKDIKKAIENSLSSFSVNMKEEITAKLDIKMPKSLKILGEHPIKIFLGDDIEFEIKAVVNQIQS